MKKITKKSVNIGARNYRGCMAGIRAGVALVAACTLSACAADWPTQGMRSTPSTLKTQRERLPVPLFLAAVTDSRIADSRVEPVADEVIYSYMPEQLVGGLQPYFYGTVGHFLVQASQKKADLVSMRDAKGRPWGKERKDAIGVEVVLTSFYADIETGMPWNSVGFGRYRTRLTADIIAKDSTGCVLATETLTLQEGQLRKATDGGHPSAELDKQRTLLLVSDMTEDLAQKALNVSIRAAVKARAKKLDEAYQASKRTAYVPSEVVEDQESLLPPAYVTSYGKSTQKSDK